ncbi:Ribonuclease H [Portunus trituberculatus]|uniref:Ribonuclease H n=1 Tax=Portunus trituberculatus TaxID=210409 RepID=A0A5B7DMN7_PORTR|nr:Ribonuclease H [Portunus trituberculatus]
MESFFAWPAVLRFDDPESRFSGSWDSHTTQYRVETAVLDAALFPLSTPCGSCVITVASAVHCGLIWVIGEAWRKETSFNEWFVTERRKAFLSLS